MKLKVEPWEANLKAFLYGDLYGMDEAHIYC